MLMGMAKPMLLAPAADGGVDADDLAAQVEQRPARVAGVDGGVGLEEVEVPARVEPGTSSRVRPLALRMPGAHGVREAERVADGDDPVAHLDRVRVAERRAGRARARRSGGRRCRCAGRARRPWPGTRGRSRACTRDLVGALDDVVVREDDAVTCRRRSRCRGPSSPSDATRPKKGEASILLARRC